MKEHFCPAEKSMITYQGKCNWCGESEGSMTQEALKLVLEVLALVRQHLEHPLGVQMTKQQIVVEVNKVSVAIKEALAQTQEPVATDWNAVHEKLELVWYRELSADEGLDEIQDLINTTPPQRTWVGLKDEEISTLWNEWKDAVCLDHKTWAKAIEAKLKEKNT